MLKKDNIVSFIKLNEGINTSEVIDKFRKKHDINIESVKRHIYNLKQNNFLEEKDKKLYSKNPFDYRFKEIIESENSYELYKNLSHLVDEILIVLKIISPSTEKKMKKLLYDSLYIRSYRFTSDNTIKRSDK